MALIHLDSFSFYDQNTIVTNGGKFENWLSEGGDVVVDGAYGRNSASGLRLVTNSRQAGNRGHVSVHFDANYDTVTVGAAVKIESDSLNAQRNELHFNFDKVIFSLLDGGVPQVSLCITPSMRLRVRRNVTGIEVARSSFVLHEGVYYYLEFKCLVSATAGSFTVRVDGATKLSGSGNTQTTVNQFINGVRLGSESPQAQVVAGRLIRFDDLYITANVAGSSYNDFIGDLVVEGRSAIGDRPGNQWSPSSGTVHYSTVDDPTPNLTDYVRAGTLGYTDTYVFSGVTVPSGSILAIVPNIYGRKTTAGMARVAPIANRQGTIEVGEESFLTQEYRYHYDQIWLRRPHDNAQWPLGFANDTFFGIKRSG